MSAITTHVLDTSTGRPVADLDVLLEFATADSWSVLARGTTDRDGRLRTLLPADVPIAPGMYRLVFQTRPYFDRLGVRSFHPNVIVSFEAVSGEPHYHVPLLLSPFGYSTYRGS